MKAKVIISPPPHTHIWKKIPTNKAAQQIAIGKTNKKKNKTSSFQANNGIFKTQ